MTMFWKNLNRLAQDQLFMRGYLALGTAAEIAAKRQAQDASECKSGTNEKRRGNSPWPRLAAFR
jgi:hypothetical protein